GPPNGGPFLDFERFHYLSKRLALAVSDLCPITRTATQITAAINVNQPGQGVLASIYMGPSTTLQEASSYGNMIFFLLLE
ncbi:MAG: hypothetical protein ACI9ND_002948, partial [Yoonia sp.]